MKAIQKRYHGPTQTISYARVSASAYGSRLYVAWQHELSEESNHKLACLTLAKQRKWFGRWQMGSLPREGDYCFVRLPKKLNLPHDDNRLICTPDSNGELER